MIFECRYEHKRTNEKWTGEITHFKNYGSHYEMIIEASSRIHVMFGRTNLGAFACMPDFGAGCHIIEPHNQSWNEERLIGVLGRVDGITVATALKILSDKINY